MVEVRPEAPGDTARVRAVHVAAFPTPLEADLVEELSDDGDTVISLVAEHGSEVVGHIVFSRMRVEADGQAVDALALGPVAVIPDRQREGIGSALIRAGLRRAEEIGTEMVFMVGEPEYYVRFGFAASTAEPFASPYAGPYFLAKVLREDCRVPLRGCADYPVAFIGGEMTIARRVRVTGRVQGVFFRVWTREEAEKLGVRGWVRNCRDGSVDAHLEGVEAAVEQLIDRMRGGPPGARVEEVRVDGAADENLTQFKVRH